MTAGAADVREATRSRVHELFAALDALDVDGLLAFFSPDVVQRLGNAEPLRGHDEVRSAVGEFTASVDSISHHITGLWEWDDTVVVRLQVTFGRQDGRVVTVPAVTIMHDRDGLIDEYDVYFDVTPVFASV
jgi:ketosteroid isomerase-like protein